MRSQQYDNAVLESTPLIVHVAAVAYTAQFLLVPQLRALQEHGYRVRVACNNEGKPWPAALAPFDPLHIPFPREIRPVTAARATASLLRAIWQLRPHLVHLHSPAAALPTRCLPRRALPRRTRIAYTVHGFPHRWEGESHRDRVLERAERVLSGRTDLTLFQSQEDFAQASERGYRPPLVYLGNGIGGEWFTPGPPPPPRTPLRLLFVGRLVREKGVLDLLDALALLPGARLDIVGEQLPSERDGVAHLIQERGGRAPLAGRVTMLGVLDPAELRTRLLSSHALVLPSYREGVPRSVIEALASGRPVVASDVRGCRELVAHGRNGFLHDPKDVRGLAAMCERIRSMPDEEYRTMCGQARASVVTRYREEAVVDRLLTAYREVLA